MGGVLVPHKRLARAAGRPLANWRRPMLGARLTSPDLKSGQLESGRSSGVEHNLAKVGVEGSNPFARSSFL